MSRIDEALQRVAAGVTAEGRTVSPIVRTPRRDDATSLDPYPAEGPSRSIADVAGFARSQPHRVIRPVKTNVQPPQFAKIGPADQGMEGKLVVDPKAAPVAVEQYRRLAGVMHELQVERNLKTLMVTSALPREGKTLTVTNLALTLSGAYGQQVLLIDADLRRPSVHQVLNLPNTVGLSEALRSDQAELPIHRVSANLSVLTGGRAESSPMALLTSVRMQILLDEAATRFQWVLLDAAPVGFMPDAAILAGMTRAILFVIAAGSTPYHLVERATSELGRDCVIGTVLNRIDDANIPAAGYYADYYDGSGG